MNAHVLRYAGSVLIRFWELAHIALTKSAMRGFGALSEGNRRVFTLEWAAGGMTLCFIGIRPPARHLPECGASSGPRTP